MTTTNIYDQPELSRRTASLRLFRPLRDGTQIELTTPRRLLHLQKPRMEPSDFSPSANNKKALHSRLMRFNYEAIENRQVRHPRTKTVVTVCA